MAKASAFADIAVSSKYALAGNNRSAVATMKDFPVELLPLTATFAGCGLSREVTVKYSRSTPFASPARPSLLRR